MGVVVSIVIGNMPFGIDIEIKVKAPKMPSISVDLDVEVELKVPHVEVEIKVPDVEVDLKVPHVEIDLDIRAKFEAEIRATLEAEAEAKIAHAVKQAVADVKCKMDQAMAHAIAEAVAEANARCDVRCAAEVTAAVASAPKSAATTWKAQPARIAMPAAEIFDAHVNKFMVRARKKFDQFDYDGNGLLEGHELVDLGEWLWSSFHPGDEASEDKKEAEGLKLLYRQDENGDGALSFDEFEGCFRKTCVAIEKYRRGLSQKPNLKCKAPKKQKMPERERIAIQADEIFDAHINKLMLRARKKFDQFDVDGNGLLEGDELVNIGEWLWSSFHPGDEASEKKKKAEGLKLLFRQDENGDGALSFDEFEGWFRKTCAAIEKYRRGLSQKPNLKVAAPKKQKMPEPKPKAQVMSVAERIKAAEHVQLAPHHSHFVQLSIHDTFIHSPMGHYGASMGPRSPGAPMAPPAPMGRYHVAPAPYGYHPGRYSNFSY